MTRTALQRLRSVLIDGKFPSKIVKVKGVSFEFVFTDNDTAASTTIVDYIEFLSKVIKCTVRGNTVPLIDLPGVYFHFLRTAYAEFQFTTLNILLEAVIEFVKSAESRGLWLTYKHSNSSYILSINGDGKLNLIQQRWIALNAMNDTKDRMEMITDIFEAVKPWLDKELYTKIKEHTKKTRENVFFDDDSYDTELREKARNIATQQNVDVEDENDLITIEEKD